MRTLPPASVVHVSRTYLAVLAANASVLLSAVSAQVPVFTFANALPSVLVAICTAMHLLRAEQASGQA